MMALLDTLITIGILVYVGLWIYMKRTGKGAKEVIKEFKEGIKNE